MGFFEILLTFTAFWSCSGVPSSSDPEELSKWRPEIKKQTHRRNRERDKERDIEERERDERKREERKRERGEERRGERERKRKINIWPKSLKSL